MNIATPAILTVVLGILSTPAHAAYWMDGIVCNDGRVKLQIDVSERRSSRLVIQDRQVKHYFLTTLTTPRDDDRGFGVDISDYFESDRHSSPRIEGPMVIQSWSGHGAWDIEHFDTAHQGPQIHTAGVVDCAPYSTACATGSAVDIRRIGSGLKVEIWRPRFFGRYCLETDSYSGQCLSYNSVGGYEAREIANWWFPSCELRELLP